MSPEVRTVRVAAIVVTTTLCVVWWAITIYSFVTYGLPEALTFAAGSVTFPILVYGMRRHSSHHTHDPESSDRR